MFNPEAMTTTKNIFGGVDNTCTARLSQFHKYSKEDMGGPLRLSFLKPHLALPILRFPSPKGYWHGTNQPLWYLSRTTEGNFEQALVIKVNLWKPDQDPPLPNAIRIGECSTSGRFWKGKWSFMDCYLGKTHLEKLLEVGGQQIQERLQPRRMPGVARLLGTYKTCLSDPSVEYWARL